MPTTSTLPKPNRAGAVRARYVSDAVDTVSPAKLVTMLYDALVRDLMVAEASLTGPAGSCDYRVVNDKLVHAQAIVLELRAGLDPEKWSGGPDLMRLYNFLLDELVKANVEKNVTKIVSCRTLVEPLQQAWHEAAATVGSGR
jgi:flagellar protein FliS